MYIQIVCMYVCMYGRKETTKNLHFVLNKKYVLFLVKLYINIKYLIDL